MGCTFVDTIEVQPIKGTVMHFHAATGHDVQCFSMERSTAIRVAGDILAAVKLAEKAERLGEVVPFVGRS